MTIGSIITGNPTVTATGAVTTTTGLDISGISGDFTVHLRVQALSASTGTAKASIQLEDSVNGFTASVPVAVKEVQQTINTNCEQHFSWRKYELPNLRAGTGSAVARVNVTVLGGTTPSLTLDSWIEY
jgi:hypothetical protein